MESNKTYMWLTIITFLGFTTGVIFGFMHLDAYKADGLNSSAAENPFSK